VFITALVSWLVADHLLLLRDSGPYVIIFMNMCVCVCVVADPVAARFEARALIARTLDHGFQSCLRHECPRLSMLCCSGLATGLITCPRSPTM
jgi:hypothetical protein